MKVTIDVNDDNRYLVVNYYPAHKELRVIGFYQKTVAEECVNEYTLSFKDLEARTLNKENENTKINY